MALSNSEYIQTVSSNYHVRHVRNHSEREKFGSNVQHLSNYNVLVEIQRS